MKCPHCGKEISDFSMKCPNCGGNPKTQATKEVIENIEINQQKQKNKSNILCIIAFTLSTIVGLFTDYIMLEIMYTGLNRTINCFLYIAIICFCSFIALKYKVYKNIIKQLYIIFISLSIIFNIIIRFIINSIEISRDIIKYLSIISDNERIIYYLSSILNIITIVFACFFLSVIISNKKNRNNI